tara:strand:- start:5011 stop:5196 length:186 start_codon:yes stop_codon:yes gene_type:complete
MLRQGTARNAHLQPVKPNATSLFALPDLRSLRFHMAWEAGLFIARLPDAPGSGKMFRLFRW